MSHLHHDSIHIPKPALWALATLLLATLMVVAGVRWSGMAIRAPDAPSVQVTHLSFRDLAGGGIDVINAKTQEHITTLDGEEGFVRGALRVLSRERLRRGLDDRDPFELHRRQDGRLTLIDPRTGIRLDLESFGPQHAGSFARLMKKDAP